MFTSPRHFTSSTQPFSHVQAEQCLRSDPSAGCYGHQLVAHQPGHTATSRQKELRDGRPKETNSLSSWENITPTTKHTDKGK